MNLTELLERERSDRADRIRGGWIEPKAEPVAEPTETEFSRQMREARERDEARQAALLDLAAGDDPITSAIANILVALEATKDRFGNSIIKHRGIADAISKLTGR